MVETFRMSASPSTGRNPWSQEKVLPPDPGPSSSTGSHLHDFPPEEQLAATEQLLRTILVDLQGHDQAPPPSLHTLRSLITSNLSEPHALALRYSRCTEAGQIYQAAEITALNIAKDIRASTCIAKATAIVPFNAP